ncbi:MAG TPA: hypothetical protein VIE65_09740 [Methylobacter sp.]
MKIAFLYGPYCLGGHGQNAFDLSNLWDDPRGMTGSELSFFMFPIEMQRRGHDVYIYSYFRNPIPQLFHGVKCRQFNNFYTDMKHGFDAAYSWNEPDLLRDVPSNILRMVNLQINSFTHCTPGFENFIDVWTSPSESHRERVIGMDHVAGSDMGPETARTYKPDPAKWTVLRNGCDPSIYDKIAETGVKKVPGRVIWASSPDRGLHWILNAWPAIKRAVPYAHLKIFYKIDAWFEAFLDNQYESVSDSTIRVQCNRARYVWEALQRLKNYDIELVKSVSRNQIAREMVEAEILAYSCDPVAWTEGFSVTLMEGCASGALPVTTDVDALGSVYGGSVPMVKAPISERLPEYTNLVIRSLTDPAFAAQYKASARSLADRHTWNLLASTLENIILGKIEKQHDS